MITFTLHVDRKTPADHEVSLTYHQRVKGRLRIVTKDGLEAGILTTRGEELLHGEKLTDGDGCVIEVCAQPEPVAVAVADSPLQLAKACYHVGNRHTEVQIEAERLVYLRDHVLDDMLRGLGLDVSLQMLPFSPENGAYSNTHTHAYSHESVEQQHDH